MARLELEGYYTFWFYFISDSSLWAQYLGWWWGWRLSASLSHRGFCKRSLMGKPAAAAATNEPREEPGTPTQPDDMTTYQLDGFQTGFWMDIQ